MEQSVTELRHTQHCLTAEEIEFKAEETEVQIVPSFSMVKLNFIKKEYGPFKAAIETTVPLWVATTLRKRQKCKIKPPAWLSATELEAILNREKTEDRFQPIHFHYMEIAQLILDCAEDDVPQANVVRAVLEDLYNVRQAKARKGLHQNLHQISDVVTLKMNDMSYMELNSIRHMATNAMGTIRKLSAEATSKNVPFTQSQSQSQEQETPVQTRRLRRYD